VPGARRVGDSNTEWQWQGVPCGAHNLVGKWDRAAGNQPKECIKGVSKEQNKTKLNYILVGRLCNLESP